MALGTFAIGSLEYGGARGGQRTPYIPTQTQSPPRGVMEDMDLDEEDTIEFI